MLAPPRPCTGSPHCPHYQGQCPVHPARLAFRGRNPPPQRITGRKNQALKLELWAANPHCALCGRLLLPSQMIRDHIIPLSEGTIDLPTNYGCHGLCRECSKRKTHEESQRGAVRNR